jgi:hypothetical protein
VWCGVVWFQLRLFLVHLFFFFSITALFPLVFGVVWFQLRLFLVRRSFFSITALFPMVDVLHAGLIVMLRP